MFRSHQDSEEEKAPCFTLFFFFLHAFPAVAAVDSFGFMWLAFRICASETSASISAVMKVKRISNVRLKVLNNEIQENKIPTCTSKNNIRFIYLFGGPTENPK